MHILRGVAVGAFHAMPHQRADVNQRNLPEIGRVEHVVRPQVQQGVAGVGENRLRRQQLFLHRPTVIEFVPPQRIQGEQVMRQSDGDAEDAAARVAHQRDAVGALLHPHPVGLPHIIAKISVVDSGIGNADDARHTSR